MPDTGQLPYLTTDVPGLGGRIKARPEDFVVEEIPLYQPGGEGTHVYFRMTKTNLPTMNALREIARALGRRPSEFGYAGLKDARAVTTQTVSLEHIDPDAIESLDLPNIRISNITRHTNKLKLGHLAGNRFCIRLREVDARRLDDATTMLQTLQQRGVPNYFGSQRFGQRGDTWQVGRAILHQDFDEAVTVMLGRARDDDFGDVAEARRHFDQGDYRAAADAWPYPFANERRLANAMTKARGDSRRAFKAIDKQLKRFVVSSYQSHLFNRIVAHRIDTIDRLMNGDLAWKHDSGAVFKVEDAVVEQPRCDAFAISPSGPIFGCKMKMPEGEPGRMERELLELEQITLDHWREAPGHMVKGARRSLRFQPREAAVKTGRDEAGEFMELTFNLDPGCYATTVLREICKTDTTQDTEDE